MAKIRIKSEKITPFGGIFHVREHFSRFVGSVIDKVLGLRCTSLTAENPNVRVNDSIKPSLMLDGVRENLGMTHA